MQTKQMKALGWLVALGAVSCSGPTQPGDPFQGYIDGAVLEAKFLPVQCGSSSSNKCYRPMTGNANGASFPFYNLGLVDKNLPLDGSRPYLPVTLVKAISYDFPEACAQGKAFDARTDAYPETAQFTVFSELPLSTSTAPVLPVVRAAPWTGVSEHTCNAIKDAESLQAGDFGGAAGAESFALRAVIDPAWPFNPLREGSTFLPTTGWYRGLMLSYLDGGALEAVPLNETSTETVVKTMDGVFVKPSSSSTVKPTDSNAVLVFQAAPGDAEWSPVVRLREFVVPSGGSASSYKRLCYDPSGTCPADSINMANVNKYLGLLFLVGSTQ